MILQGFGVRRAIGHERRGRARRHGVGQGGQGLAEEIIGDVERGLGARNAQLGKLELEQILVQFKSDKVIRLLRIVVQVFHGSQISIVILYDVLQLPIITQTINQGKRKARLTEFYLLGVAGPINKLVISTLGNNVVVPHQLHKSCKSVSEQVFLILQLRNRKSNQLGGRFL